MPYAFDVDWKHLILRMRLYGQVTNREIREFYRAGFKLNFHTQPVAGIADLSAISVLRVSDATIYELAEAWPVMPNQALPRVIIAPSSNTYRVARLFELHGEATRPNLHVVRTEREAFAIIGVLRPTFVPLDWIRSGDAP